jgi:hypothetical protein
MVKKGIQISKMAEEEKNLKWILIFYENKA